MMPLFGHPDVAELKAKRDIKGLVRAVGDRDETVRQDASEAIVELRDPAALIPVLKRWKALHWEKCHEARNAFMSLAVELKGEAVPILIEVLGKRDLDAEAANRLGKIGDPRAIEPLCAMVADRKLRLSHPSAIKALAQFRDPRATDALIGALSSDYSLARVCAAEALAEMGDPKAVEPLAAALERADDLDSRNRIGQAVEKLAGAPAPTGVGGQASRMLGRKSEFEKELGRRIGADRAAEISRELGKEIVSNPIIKRGADTAAEAVALIAQHRGPEASAHEIAAEFVEQLSRASGN
jgi:HEAT repeat protein